MNNLRFKLSLLLTGMLWFGCTQERFINEPGNLVPKTVDEDASLPSIRVNGTQLHAEAFGNPYDPMIVVLHGGPGSDYRNLLYCKEFANDGYRVVFYDQRGTGLSQRVPYASFTMKGIDDDLAAVIAYYRTSPSQKVFLLGHSWGAMLATGYINQYPTAIAGAVIAEPGGLKWSEVKEYTARTSKLNILGEAVNDGLFLDQFITGKQNDHAILDYKFAQWAAVGDSEGSPLGNEGRTLHWRGGAATFRAYLDLGNELNPDWTTNLAQYKTRVLFVYSENNRAYGLEHAQKVSAAYPNAQLFECLGAGHDMFSFPIGWNNSYPIMLNYYNSLK